MLTAFTVQLLWFSKLKSWKSFPWPPQFVYTDHGSKPPSTGQQTWVCALQHAVYTTIEGVAQALKPPPRDNLRNPGSSLSCNSKMLSTQLVLEY